MNDFSGNMGYSGIIETQKQDITVKREGSKR